MFGMVSKQLSAGSSALILSLCCLSVADQSCMSATSNAQFELGAKKEVAVAESGLRDIHGSLDKLLHTLRDVVHETERNDPSSLYYF